MLFIKEQELLPLVNQAAQKYNVPPALILAHMKQESSFNPDAYRAEPAINDASMGLMQMLVRTARSFDSGATLDKLRDPAYSIDLGTAYIAQNMAKYPDVKDAIAAYNAGVPRKNSAGQYVNSKGVTNVQGYVDKVYKNYVVYSEWLDKGAKSVEVTMIDPVLISVIVLSGVAVVFFIRRRIRRGQGDRTNPRQRRGIQGRRAMRGSYQR